MRGWQEIDSDSVVVLTNAYDVDKAFLGVPLSTYSILIQRMSSLKRQPNPIKSLQMPNRPKTTKKTPTYNANMTS